MDIVFAATGLVVLLLAGDALVRGAVNLGLRLGVPVLIVSLTVVAFGTSAPELLIAVQAVMKDLPGIAVGNVVGSNIANILMVMGFPALLFGINSSQCDSRKTYGFMLGATVIFIALAFLGPLFFWHGVILLALLGAMLTESFLSAQKHRREGNGASCGDDLEELEEADPAMPLWKIVLYLVLGVVGLPLGAQLLIDGALGIARQLGVSEAVIGLTLVAIGTSLPELATTLAAAMRRHGDVVLGNAIGSNMFNILGIMGVASFFGPVDIPAEFLRFDLWVMLAASLVILPFVFGKLNINRIWGGVLSLLYIIYMVVLLA